MKTIKILTVAFCVIMLSSPLFAEGIKGKITFRGGSTFLALKSVTSWNIGWQLYHLIVAEWGSQHIQQENRFFLFFNGSVAVFVKPYCAIEWMVGYCKMNIGAVSYFTSVHGWVGRFGSPDFYFKNDYEYSKTKGYLRITPININVLFQPAEEIPVTPYISGGFTIAPCRINIDAYTGFVYSEICEWQQMAEIITNAPIKLDESFTSLGFNIGAGVDIRISRSLEINIEARYIKLQDHKFYWKMIRDRVQGKHWGTWIFSQEFIDEFNNTYLTQEGVLFNPSIYTLSGGITFRF